MAYSLDKVTIKGFKSIKSLENFELRNLNVLIGGNGAGKSNFIDFFRLLRAMMQLSLPELSSSNLDIFINKYGGSFGFLFNGPKVTGQIESEIFFGPNGYRFKLESTTHGMFQIIEEESIFEKDPPEEWSNIGSGNQAPRLLFEKDRPGVDGGRSIASYIFESIASSAIYHFHDTSLFAPMKLPGYMHDTKYLRFDGANIAPYLLYLRNVNNDIYRDIVETIRMIAPFFDDFILEPDTNNQVWLHWKQKGSDFPLTSQHLSDGTLRFICLTTALSQPILPSTIILDEPELGLHPFAIGILAELIEVASRDTQLIVATQSPTLVDYFEPKDIVVVNREKGESTFRRIDNENLSVWLAEYSLGQLWQKNVILGGPDHE